MKKFFLYLMAAVYILAGLNHFINPDIYVGIMPLYLPWHYELVIISGIFEVLLGILLLVPRTQRIAAWGIILLLIAIFPANIQMAVDFWKEGNPYLWVALVRLPLQIGFIWWAWLYARKPRAK